jgi:hypothetical protein
MILSIKRPETMFVSGLLICLGVVGQRKGFHQLKCEIVILWTIFLKFTIDNCVEIVYTYEVVLNMGK